MNYSEAMVGVMVTLGQYTIYLFILPLLIKITLHVIKHQTLKKNVGGKMGLHQRNRVFLTLNVGKRVLGATFPVASGSVI